MAFTIFRPGLDDGSEPPDVGPFPGGCITFDPEPRHPGGDLKEWTLDACPHVVAGITVRPATHISGVIGEDEEGDTAVVSAHRVRAVDIAAENNEEPCLRHYGRMTLGMDGDARMVFCSDHVRATDTSSPDQQTHEGLMFLASRTGAGQPEFLETGDAAILTSISTPAWHEVHLLTHAPRCFGIPTP